MNIFSIIKTALSKRVRDYAVSKHGEEKIKEAITTKNEAKAPLRTLGKETLGKKIFNRISKFLKHPIRETYKSSVSKEEYKESREKRRNFLEKLDWIYNPKKAAKRKYNIIIFSRTYEAFKLEHSKNEISIFWQTTKPIWAGLSNEDRLQAIVDYFGTEDFSEIYEIWLEDMKKINPNFDLSELAKEMEQEQNGGSPSTVLYSRGYTDR